MPSLIRFRERRKHCFPPFSVTAPWNSGINQSAALSFRAVRRGEQQHQPPPRERPTVTTPGI